MLEAPSLPVALVPNCIFRMESHLALSAQNREKGSQTLIAPKENVEVRAQKQKFCEAFLHGSQQPGSICLSQHRKWPSSV